MRESLLSAPVISGSCLLTSEEIQQLSRATTEDYLWRMCGNHPNPEDLLYGGFPRRKTPFPLYYWFETKEFADLVVIKTRLPFNTALDAFIDEAHRIEKALSLAPCVTARFLYTHDPEISERLSHLAEKYAVPFLRIMDEKGIPLPVGLRRLINNDPGRCNFLHVFCTYSPEAIGEEIAVVIEPLDRHIPILTFGDNLHHGAMLAAAPELFGIEPFFIVNPHRFHPKGAGSNLL